MLIEIKGNRTQIFYPKLKLALCPERNATQASHPHAQEWEQQAMHPQSLSSPDSDLDCTGAR